MKRGVQARAANSPRGAADATFHTQAAPPAALCFASAARGVGHSWVLFFCTYYASCHVAFARPVQRRGLATIRPHGRGMCSRAAVVCTRIRGHPPLLSIIPLMQAACALVLVPTFVVHCVPRFVPASRRSSLRSPRDLSHHPHHQQQRRRRPRRHLCQRDHRQSQSWQKKSQTRNSSGRCPIT